jgi:hypothetical protein
MQRQVGLAVRQSEGHSWIGGTRRFNTADAMADIGGHRANPQLCHRPGQVAAGLTGGSGKAQADAHYEHSSKRSTTTQRESSHLDYRPIGDETIQVGPPG